MNNRGEKSRKSLVFSRVLRLGIGLLFQKEDLGEFGADFGDFAGEVDNRKANGERADKSGDIFDGAVEVRRNEHLDGLMDEVNAEGAAGEFLEETLCARALKMDGLAQQKNTETDERESKPSVPDVDIKMLAEAEMLDEESEGDEEDGCGEWAELAVGSSEKGL